MNEYAQLQDGIAESKFNRYITHDIQRYRRYVAEGGAVLYSAEELDALDRAGVSERLPPRATAYYMDLAKRSRAIRNLIKARPEETADLTGEADPSNQLRYSPVAGLLHKYELILLYVVRSCSSWCRYCYRSDFLTGKTEKDIASLDDVQEYIEQHNHEVRRGLTDKPPIREALLSGGDPMVLSNRKLFGYLEGLADTGVEVIRIGTKEMAFFPARFDDNFFEMLDLFHQRHPDVLVAFMTHFTHPDEFLLLDDAGEYVRDDHGRYLRNPVVAEVMQRVASRPYTTMENQTPIIDSVNDDPNALRLMQRELKRMGTNNLYFFQCREIEGHRAFAVPVETAWKLHNESQHGLSGIERSRFVLATEAGKLEMVAVVDGFDRASLCDLPPDVARLVSDGFVIFRLHRTPDESLQGGIVVARRNPAALWISGYEDRIIYDGRQPETADKLAPMLQLLASSAVNVIP